MSSRSTAPAHNASGNDSTGERARCCPIKSSASAGVSIGRVYTRPMLEPSIAAVAAALGRTLHARMAPRPAAQVQGGCINESYRWEGDRGALFVKLAAADCLLAFEAEAAGLEELRSANAV